MTASLTTSERNLVDAASRGELLVCSDLPVDQLADAVDPAHVVRAEMLRDLLRGRHGQVDPRGIQLSHARIVGRLDLDGISSDSGLSLQSCAVDEITAVGATLPSLGLRESRINSLLADGLSVMFDLHLDRLRVSGQGELGALRLLGARIGDQLILSEAWIANSDGPALNADRLVVGGNLLLDRASIQGDSRFGALRLLGARIGDQLVLSQTEIVNFSSDGPVLYADRLEVDGSVDFSYASVRAGRSFDALSLAGARIGGNLILRKVDFPAQGGPVLNLERAHVEGTATVSASALCIEPGNRRSCLSPKLVALGGFTYRDLGDVAWQEWLHILRFHTSKYEPSQYQQLAAVQRAVGFDANARNILIAQQLDLSRRAPHAIGGLWTRLAHRLWGQVLGYGYQIRRLVAALLLALVVAACLGYWAGHVTDGGHHSAERVATFGDAVGKPCSAVELFGVGLDRGLPLSPTGVRSRCDINPDTAKAGEFTVAIWVVQAAVWSLATLALAFYTSLARRST